jgi:beta-galactosidase
VADTYFNMKRFTKGYLWVNGYNLGRFWEVGPQLKLFCPGVWMKRGLNEIYVLDLKASAEKEH